MPFVEPFIPVEYKFTGQLETAVIDLTSVNEDTLLDSKWDSEFYTTRSMIRFDPLSQAGTQKNTAMSYAAQVEAGAKIDIA